MGFSCFRAPSRRFHASSCPLLPIDHTFSSDFGRYRLLPRSPLIFPFSPGIFPFAYPVFRGEVLGFHAPPKFRVVTRGRTRPAAIESLSRARSSASRLRASARLQVVDVPSTLTLCVAPLTMLSSSAISALWSATILAVDHARKANWIKSVAVKMPLAFSYGRKRRTRTRCPHSQTLSCHSIRE